MSTSVRSRPTTHTEAVCSPYQYGPVHYEPDSTQSAATDTVLTPQGRSIVPIAADSCVDSSTFMGMHGEVGNRNGRHVRPRFNSPPPASIVPASAAWARTRLKTNTATSSPSKFPPNAEFIVISDDSADEVPSTSSSVKSAQSRIRKTRAPRKVATSRQQHPVLVDPSNGYLQNGHLLPLPSKCHSLEQNCYYKPAHNFRYHHSSPHYQDPVEQYRGPTRKRTRLSSSPAHTHKKRPTQQPYEPVCGPITKSRDVALPKIPDIGPLVSLTQQAQSSPAESQQFDDPEGHYIFKNGSKFAGKYQVVRQLGQGTFGKVVAAYDLTTGEKIAIKVIRAVQKYREASKIELRVLSTLLKFDPDNKNRCIQLRQCFDYRNHVCIVTDLLSISLFDFMKSNNFLGFPLSHVQSFARQLLRSVCYLHDLRLIHTDLKPENILLENCEYQTISQNNKKNRSKNILLDPSIQLIDFGSAVFDDEYHSAVVSTRHYRAPEIILGIGWSFPCDMWSIGCILVEFVTGEALFQTHDNLEHLALMQRVLDEPFSKSIVARALGRSGSQYFNNTTLRLKYPDKDTEKTSEKYVQAMKPLEKILAKAVASQTKKPHWPLFLDLLRRIFVYDPDRRISAIEALRHSWLESQIDDEARLRKA